MCELFQLFVYRKDVRNVSGWRVDYAYTTRFVPFQTQYFYSSPSSYINPVIYQPIEQRSLTHIMSAYLHGVELVGMNTAASLYIQYEQLEQSKHLFLLLYTNNTGLLVY